MRELSTRQKAIYDFIIDATDRYGYPPSVREICEAVNLKSPSTVHTHLKYLESRGYIQREGNKTRAISLPSDERRSMSKKRIPILGVVAAGTPILAEQNVEGYVGYFTDDNNHEYFALRIRGDSMINAGIVPGDVVVVRRQKTARSGQIVVGMIDGEATVKKLKLLNGEIWLMPENPDYDPIDGSECEILGIVTALVREY